MSAFAQRHWHSRFPARVTNSRRRAIFSKFELALAANNLIDQLLWPLEDAEVQPTSHRFPAVPEHAEQCSKLGKHGKDSSGGLGLPVP